MTGVAQRLRWRRMVPRGLTSRSVVSVAIIASLFVAACSSSDDDDAAVPASTIVDDVTAETSVAGDESAPAGTEPATDDVLGFDTDEFVIPAPGAEDPDLDPALAGFSTVDELIDGGVEAGVWTEVEATRAIVSVIMGELSPAAVPGMDELAHPSIPAVLDRAEVLLADETIDDDQRADLARVTAFFFDSTPPGDLGESTTVTTAGAEGLRGRPQSIRRAPRQGVDCEPIGQDPSGFFDAAEARLGTSYCRAKSGADEVIYPSRIGGKAAPEVFAASAVRLFEIIDRARTGYEDLAGTEMPPVKFLISARTDPSNTPAEGHVISKVGADQCIGAIFATAAFFEQSIELDNTMAHELFHCVQGAWGGTLETEFVGEAGASYFAYKLLGECAPDDAARVGRLDANTANGSLLATAYEGWFFWAFLDEHTDLDSRLISQMHQEIAGGTPPDDAIRAYVSNLPRTLNEFFVRLMGPGLACGAQGNRFTDKIAVSDTGPIDLPDADWQGSRYELTYPKSRYFTQMGDGGPMGMALEKRRDTEGGWVVYEPEIRSTCEDEEKAIVVVAGSETGQSRNVEILERQDASCDPCPIGAWNIDLDSMAAFYETFDSNGFDVTITGTWQWQFAGGDNGQPGVMSDDENIQLAFGGFQGPSVVSTGQGQWTGDGSTLTVSDYASSTGASFFGVDATTSDSGQGAVVGYECEGDVMTVTTRGVTILLNRIDPLRGEPYFG